MHTHPSRPCPAAAPAVLVRPALLVLLVLLVLVALLAVAPGTGQARILPLPKAAAPAPEAAPAPVPSPETTPPPAPEPEAPAEPAEPDAARRFNMEMRTLADQCRTLGQEVDELARRQAEDTGNEDLRLTLGNLRHLATAVCLADALWSTAARNSGPLLALVAEKARIIIQSLRTTLGDEVFTDETRQRLLDELGRTAETLRRFEEEASRMPDATRPKAQSEATPGTTP